MAETTVSKVADYFVCRTRDVGDLITNLKIQKLAYYAQAWYVARAEARLVDGEFQAWVHGPVSPELYDRFKVYQANPISEDVVEPIFSEPISEHLAEVFEVYGAFSGLELERLTHSERPWIDARGGLPPDAPSNAVIPIQSMAAFYRPLLEEIDG